MIRRDHTDGTVVPERYRANILFLEPFRRICDGLFAGSQLFGDVERRIRNFADAAKLKCETLRTDPVIFEVWPTFVTAGDQLSHIRSRLPLTTGDGDKREAEDGIRLIEQGKKLLTYIARARVSMPKSMQSFIAQCDHYSQTYPKGIQDQPEPTDRKAD